MKEHLATFVLVFVAGVFSFTYANAATYEQPIQTDEVIDEPTTGAYYQDLGNGLIGHPWYLYVYGYADTAAELRFQVNCYTDAARTVACPELPDNDHYFGYSGTAGFGSWTGNVGTLAELIRLEMGSTTFEFQPHRYYEISPEVNAVTDQHWYGYSSGSGGRNFTGALFYRIYTDAGPIDWDNYVGPALLASTSASAIATSSSLWGDYDATTTLIQLERCVDSGNLFSRAICLSFSYLFTPNPRVLDSWASVPTQLSAKFPFSWVSSVQTSLQTAAASSTGNMPLVAMNLHDLNIGSSSPMGNIMPNFVALSTTTVREYIPDTIWNAGQLLMQTTLWMALCFDIYATVRRRHAHV